MLRYSFASTARDFHVEFPSLARKAKTSASYFDVACILVLYRKDVSILNLRDVRATVSAHSSILRE